MNNKNHKEYKARLKQEDIPEIDNLNKRYWDAVVPVSADIIYYKDEVHIFHNSVSGVCTYIPPVITRGNNHKLLKNSINKIIKKGASTHTYVFEVCKIVHVKNDVTNVLYYTGNQSHKEGSKGIIWRWQPRYYIKYGLQKGRYVLFGDEWVRTDTLEVKGLINNGK